MKQRKRKGLMISIILVMFIIIALIGTIAYLYFFMDMFKTNKQLFLEYSAQLVQSENGFIENQLIQYLQKKTNTSYENNGEVTFDVDIPNKEDDIQLTNDLKISFTGKNDPSNAKIEKEVTLKYSNDVEFPLTFRKTSNIVGIQTHYIGNNYVAVRTGEDISGLDSINNLLELENIEFSNEEIQNLKNSYFYNQLNGLDDSKFSQMTDENLTGYKLTLSVEELKNIFKQTLNILKGDTNTTHKLNAILKGVGLDELFDEDGIDEIIDDIDDMELKEDVELTVFQSAGKLVRIDMNVAKNKIQINKEVSEQNIIYTANLDMEEKNNQIEFVAKFSEVSSESVTETYELTAQFESEEEATNNTISETATNETTSNNTTSETATNETTSNNTTSETATNETTSNNTTSETATNETTSNNTTSEIATSDTIANNTTSETATSDTIANNTTNETSTNNTTNQSSRNNLKTESKYKYSITNKVDFKSGIQIEDLSSNNAVILNDRDNEYVNNLVNAIQERIKEVNRVQMEELGVMESENPINYLLPEALGMNTTTSEVDEQAVNSFNAKFELYQSTNTKGATVKGLLTTIQNSNESEESNKIEEINVDGEEYEVTDQNITFLKSSINVDDSYRVEFEKNIDTGLIYRAVINKR